MVAPVHLGPVTRSSAPLIAFPPTGRAGATADRIIDRIIRDQRTASGGFLPLGRSIIGEGDANINVTFRVADMVRGEGHRLVIIINLPHLEGATLATAKGDAKRLVRELLTRHGLSPQFAQLAFHVA